MLACVDVGSEEAVKVFFWLHLSHTYQAREVQEPEKKMTNSNGSGGMVEVGRRGEEVSPPQPILGSRRSFPDETIHSNSEDGSDGMWWWVGRDGGTSPYARLGEVIT